MGIQIFFPYNASSLRFFTHCKYHVHKSIHNNHRDFTHILTDEWIFTSVDSTIHIQFASLCELLVTVWTGERFFASVNFMMPIQFVTLFELHVTIRTNERFFTGVNSTTLNAYGMLPRFEWLILWLMQSITPARNTPGHNFKIDISSCIFASLCELLVTVWTGERFFASVNFMMPIQFVTLLELHVTIRTNERFFTGVNSTTLNAYGMLPRLEWLILWLMQSIPPARNTPGHNFKIVISSCIWILMSRSVGNPQNLITFWREHLVWKQLNTRVYSFRSDLTIKYYCNLQSASRVRKM